MNESKKGLKIKNLHFLFLVESGRLLSALWQLKDNSSSFVVVQENDLQHNNSCYLSFSVGLSCIMDLKS